jgi:hypothetical protein
MIPYESVQLSMILLLSTPDEWHGDESAGKRRVEKYKEVKESQGRNRQKKKEKKRKKDNPVCGIRIHACSVVLQFVLWLVS